MPRAHWPVILAELMSSRFTERLSLKKSWERHLRKILEVNLWPPHMCAHQICTHTDMDTDTQSKWSVYKETRVLVKRAQHQIMQSPAVTLWEGWERTSLSQGSRESRAEEATRTLSVCCQGGLEEYDTMTFKTESCREEQKPPVHKWVSVPRRGLE